MQRTWHKLILTCIFILAVATFFTGIDWGLPSRESDSILFGDRTPWTGAQIMAMAGPWDQSAGRGADIAMHPLLDRQAPIVLNDTDARRAEIVRRYRLYSSQPDEMITFRSLSGMKPGQFKLDPKMYQYGGLWIYPVGGLLKIASLFQLLTLRTDLAFYLDQPVEFGKFYLLARTYSAVWGLLGVWVVYRLGREWTGQYLVGATAAGLFASMPVVIDLAHEAKPHLAGTVLILLTILTAMRYVQTGTRRSWMLAGVFAGASLGMVLTGYVAFGVLPVMAILRTASWKNRAGIALASGLIGIATFTLTNPYLPVNYLFHRELLHSNVGNYGTFYQPGLSLTAFVTTGRSLLEGTSLPVAVVGGLALCLLWPMHKKLNRITARRPVAGSQHLLKTSTIPMPPSPFAGLLLVTPAVLVMFQMVLLADGKTAEYARFALLVDVLLALSAAALVGAIQLKPGEKVFVALFLVAATLFYGLRYDANFLLDGRERSTRREASRVLGICGQQSHTLGVMSEPAPYCLPPVDLFTWRMILMPLRHAASDIPPGTILVRPVDEIAIQQPPGIRRFHLTHQATRPASPISWANKPFEILSSNRLPVSPATTRP